MTTVYFIRHAESDTSVHDDATRPLTEAGERAAANLPRAFEGVALDAVYSSPYLRAMRTVVPLALGRGLTVIQEPDFRERRIDSEWIEDYESFAQRQWADHAYKLSDGESIGEAQARGIAALRRVLNERAGQSVAIGTHGGLLGAMLNHFDPSFGYAQFQELLPKLPCVYKFVFDGTTMVTVAEVPLG